MDRLNKIIDYWREGTLWQRLLRRLGGTSPARVRWYGASNAREATLALVAWARNHHRLKGGWILVLGAEEALSRAVCNQLQAAGIPYRHMDEQALSLVGDEDAGEVAAVLSTHLDVAGQTEAARRVSAHPLLADKPFEYVYGLDEALAQFHRQDEYADTDFVSPLLLDKPTPYAIYEESLQYFEQKCGLRDYLDLYQALRHIVRNDIPGDIAEFGSYQGHSGWLIARSLEALGDSQRRLFLFDTFEGFPEETGLDHFWAHTHQVHFQSIQAKFAERENVRLVKGDFTKTFPESKVGQLALAYIDCDSYRATKWLIETLWPDRITRRGALVFEDYGHPALLGNRVAVHNGLPESAGGIHFYSQFSGLYFVYRA